LTVAAIVMVPEPAVALAPVDEEPPLRRGAQSAWAGGALPTIVVMPRSSDEARQAVADLAVTFAAPSDDEPKGIAWFVRGMRTARETVVETTAALLWPVPRVWVDPETVTSLIEAHGTEPEAILRPAYKAQGGFPILVPLALMDQLGAQSGKHGEEAIAEIVARGAPQKLLELGDPGIVHDIATPRSELPPYQGPDRPANALEPPQQV
jgi:CTP:molybdopterin cytidylyltransferase MocA